MIVSAPGKVIIFGEHAVVYGKRALVTAISLRCYVKAKKSNEFKIKSELGITGLDFEKHAFVSQAIKRFSEVEDVKGVEVEVKSQIPPASGLGSSAAVTVATISALNELFSTSLTKDEIFEIARKVELDVQGRGSGTDPFISTFGGTWLVPEKKKIECGLKEIYIYNTGSPSITSKMVGKVAKARSEMPDVFERIFDAIDSVTMSGVEHFKKGNVSELEKLFFINQKLLSAIGVSTPEIERKILELEERGVYAKITGAGGGGCIISLKSFEGSTNVRVNEEGVRVEDFEDWRFADN